MKNIVVFLICLLFTLPAYAKDYEKQKKHKQLPPGLQKKLERTGELPPGWEKKLQVGEVLDDDIYGHSTPVTGENDVYEYEVKPGTEVVQIEDKIIRITKGTREILEILRGGNTQ